MTSRSFVTPIPRLAARLIQSTLGRARQLHTGKLPRIPAEPFAVKLQGLGFSLEFAADNNTDVSVTSLPEPQAVTVICATPASLALQAANGNPGGRIEISGDASLAQRWQQYFAAFKPDWEQGLSQRLGPVLGYQIANGLQQLLGTVQTNYLHTAEMISEYLQEESRLLIPHAEMQHFLDAVDDLAERVDRLIATQAAK